MKKVLSFWRSICKEKIGDSRNLQRLKKKSPGISSAGVGNPSFNPVIMIGYCIRLTARFITRQIIILVTDGVPNAGVDQLQPTVNAIKNAGIRIDTVGVTNLVG